MCGGRGAGKGKTIALKDGKNEVGRALTCQVSLDGDGISKVHAIITVEGTGMSAMQCVHLSRDTGRRRTTTTNCCNYC
jgi:hypothetical protein